MDLHALPCAYRTSASDHRLFMGAEDVRRLSDYTDVHFVDRNLYLDRPKMCAVHGTAAEVQRCSSFGKRFQRGSIKCPTKNYLLSINCGSGRITIIVLLLLWKWRVNLPTDLCFGITPSLQKEEGRKEIKLVQSVCIQLLLLSNFPLCNEMCSKQLLPTQKLIMCNRNYLLNSITKSHRYTSNTHGVGDRQRHKPASAVVVAVACGGGGKRRRCIRQVLGENL